MSGSFPEPTELLSVKKVNGNPSTRLPPPGRSPIKTSLGSSPRRPPSTGPPSRIKRTSNGITPPPRVNRKLDYSPNEVTPSIEQVSGESTLIRQSEAGKNSTKISAIESSPPLETNNSVNGLIRGPEEPQIRLSSNFEDSIPFFNGDESVEIVQSDVPIDPLLTQESATSSAIVTDKGKDKPRHSDHEVTSEMQDQENRVTSDPFQGPRESTSKEAESGVEKAQRDNTLIEISPAQNAKHGKRKRKRLELSDEEPDPRKMVAGQTPVKSLPKNSFQDHCKRQAVRSLQEPVPLQSQQAQKKRARRTKEQKEQSPTKRRKTSELLPSDHDSDAQMGIPSIEEPEESYRNTPYEPVSSRANSRADSVAPSTAPGLKRPGPRSLTLLRQGTPLEEDGARMTRSGRTSVKPFKWWLNEGYEYSKGHITGVTRAEEVEQPKKKAPARRKLAGKSGSRLQSIEEDTENEDEAEGKPEQSRPNYEEEDEPAEEWEENDGTLSGIVKRYDSFMEAGTREEVETGTCNQCLTFSTIPWSRSFSYVTINSHLSMSSKLLRTSHVSITEELPFFYSNRIRVNLDRHSGCAVGGLSIRQAHVAPFFWVRVGGGASPGLQEE